MDKIKISIVNYTNTLPFKWAIKNSPLISRIDLQEDIPSICAQKLKYGQVDLALMPVAVLSELDHYTIETDYCIGAQGRVDSVKLYSEVPLEQIKTVTLDYQSRSSITLTRVLMKFFWQKTVTYNDALPGFEQRISGAHAAIVIGDRTFTLNGKHRYEYDLAQEWKNFTGLPFVFAAWVSRSPLPADFLLGFNAVLRHGIENTGRAVDEAGHPEALTRDQTLEYLTRRIDYRLDAAKREALDKFLAYIREL